MRIVWGEADQGRWNCIRGRGRSCRRRWRRSWRWKGLGIKCAGGGGRHGHLIGLEDVRHVQRFIHGFLLFFPSFTILATKTALRNVTEKAEAVFVKVGRRNEKFSAGAGLRPNRPPSIFNWVLFVFEKAKWVLGLEWKRIYAGLTQACVPARPGTAHWLPQYTARAR